MRPGGNIDYYELLLKKSDRENETLKLVNVTTGKHRNYGFHI